jgi:hypothetical protein
MPEMILPGTYIEVRAEGLISAGRISTGNIGIVGTASRGSVDEVHLIGSLAEAKAIFGESDEWIDGAKNELTLIRALDLIYKNGGRTVYAVRTAPHDNSLGTVASKASFSLGQDGSPLLNLEATTPGTWGNDIKIAVTTLEAITPTKMKADLIYGFVQESYEFSNVEELCQKINLRSSLVTATLATATLPTRTDQGQLPNKVENTSFTSGSNGEGAIAQDYAQSLELLENQDVNIVLLAGQSVTTDKVMVAVLEGHLKTTAEIKRERIGIIGSGSDNLDDVTNHGLNSDRLIFTAPGVLVTANGKQSKLPGGYLAAAVAGLISSLPVHTSPTNKVLAIEGLTTTFNSSKLEKLTQSRVCAIEQRNGFRIVKGITTNDEAWQQITTRRIVDYAIYGVRSSCDPYIGKLNNERVRGAMKATLDGFLTRMVENEALVSYELDVSATRAQQLAGEAIVTITLSPTFSIDFIKVTMYLS